MPSSLWRQNIKLLRKKFSKNQSTLALELKTSQQTIGNWENGIGSPDIDQMAEIAKIFGITIDELLNKDYSNAHLNTNNLGKGSEQESTPKRTPNRTPNAENEVKSVIQGKEKPVYGTGFESATYWHDKYIALLELKAAEKPIAYVPLETYEVLATRFDALQSFVMEQLSLLNHKAVKDLAFDLHVKGNELMKAKKKHIHSDVHT